MRECYPIIIGNYTNARLTSRSFARPRDTGTGTLHGRERINTRDYALANAARFRLGRRDENGVGFSRQLSAKERRRASFSSACARGRVFDRPKVLVAGVSVARAAARRFHERARGPSVAFLPELAMGQCVSHPPADAADDDVVDFPASKARTSTKARTTFRERAGLSPRTRARIPAPAVATVAAPSRAPPAAGATATAAATAPPRPSTRTARAARGAAPSSLLEASTRRRARHRARDEKTRTYAKLRAFADAMPRRDRIAPIVAPKRDVPRRPGGALRRVRRRRRRRRLHVGRRSDRRRPPRGRRRLPNRRWLPRGG